MTETANESWVVWELMGATDGRTRGAMTALLGTTAASAAYQGWDLKLKLSSVGSDGNDQINHITPATPGSRSSFASLHAGRFVQARMRIACV